jgi:hypothetical protein
MRLLDGNILLVKIAPGVKDGVEYGVEYGVDEGPCGVDFIPKRTELHATLANLANLASPPHYYPARLRTRYHH